MTQERHEERIAVLEAELGQLKDIEEIRSLRLRYHDAINQHRIDDICQLFTEDAVIDFGTFGGGEGRTAIHNFFSSSSKLFQFVKQFIHNHHIHLDGDKGTGRSYLESRAISNGIAYNIAGRCDDSYARTDEGWRFAKMRIFLFYALPFDQDWAQDDLLQMVDDLKKTECQHQNVPCSPDN